MRVTTGLISVAAAMMAAPDDRHWGYQLSRETGVRSGVLYPMLGRLFEAGWLTDGWEDAAVAAAEKRPPRRFYELTDLGRAELGAIANRQAAGKAWVTEFLGEHGHRPLGDFA